MYIFIKADLYEQYTYLVKVSSQVFRFYTDIFKEYQFHENRIRRLTVNCEKTPRNGRHFDNGREMNKSVHARRSLCNKYDSSKLNYDR